MNLEKLNKFLLDLDNKYDINSGACALIAYMLSSWCVKNNISYKKLFKLRYWGKTLAVSTEIATLSTPPKYTFDN